MIASHTWRLPAEPVIDRLCAGLVFITAVALLMWALQWAHSEHWGLEGPRLLASVFLVIAPWATAWHTPLAIDAFFWLVLAVLALCALGLRSLLRQHRLARAWALHHEAGRWTWWAVDDEGRPEAARQGDLRVRLSLGPWLLLQGCPRGDWMLVRTDRLGPKGADGHRLRTALTWT